MKKQSLFRLVSVMLLLSVFCIMLLNYSNASISTNTPVDASEITEEDLPVVGTVDNFKKLIEYTKIYNQIFGGIRDNSVMTTAKTAEVAQGSGNAGAAQNSADYSKTNIQVEGVDEADVVKTDGEYIYQVNNRKIVVLKAYPAAEMKIVNTVEFSDNNFYPSEIYADSHYMTVIGSSYTEIRYGDPEEPNKKEIRPPHYPNTDKSTVKIIVYDINDKEDIKELRQAEIEGHYISSRKIDTKVYIVSNKYIDYYILENEDADTTPVYRDSKVSNEFRSIGYEDIKYFPDTPCSNYMLIGALDISDGKPMDVQTYLGAGQNIYVSNKNLYTAVTKYDVKNLQEMSTQARHGEKAKNRLKTISSSLTAA